MKNIKIDANRNMILVIGPQASGKSTIARLLFFCRKIRDYYVDCLCEDAPFSTVPNEGTYEDFLRYVDRYFCGFFDDAMFMHPFEFSYSYPSGETLFIHSNGKITSYEFSPVLEEKLRDSFRNKPEQKKRLRSHLSKISNELFGFDEETVYIPAGRSILSLLSERVDVCDFSASDPVMGDFVEKVRMARNQLRSMPRVTGSKQSQARDLVRKILNADGEKLIHATSGQQESLWILLLLLFAVLENRKTFFILEELEAHLHPSTQKDLVELAALTMNSADCRFFITTHSPCVLTSANLLIQSAAVENRIPAKAEETVVTESLRISPEKVSAYETGGTLQDLIDEETGLIDSLTIDRVSEEINAASDRLIDLEFQYNLL